MTGESGMTDFDRLVTSWLTNDGPQDVRPELVEAAIVGAGSTRQHRGLEGALFGSGAWPRRRSARWPFAGITFRRLAILVVILLLAAVGAVLVGARIRLPSLIDSKGSVDHLLYSVDGDVYLADADGGNAVRVADGTSDAPFSWVAWSPDGNHLSYDDGNTVYVADINGKTEFTTPGCCSVWSPDGASIATFVIHAGSHRSVPADLPNNEDIEVVILDRTGLVRSRQTVPGPLNFLGSGMRAHWSPDGRWITLDGVEWGGPDRGLGILIPVGGGSPTLLPVAPVRGSASFFSPDGTKVVGHDLHGELVVAAADGSGARPLVPDFRVPVFQGWHGALWSPDSTRIAATAATERAETLYVIDVATGDIRAVRTYAYPESADAIAFSLYAISWDGERDRLLFMSEGSSTSTSGLWTIGVDGSDPQLLLDGAYEGDFQPPHVEQP